MFTSVLQIDDDIYYKELWSVHGKNIQEIKKLVDSTKKRLERYSRYMRGRGL